MAANTYTEQSSTEVAERLRKGELFEIIDVREAEEWESGHIAEAKHIPLGQLEQRLHEIDPNKETVVVCRSGNRSGIACQFLQQLGHNVINMSGGMMNWTGDVQYGK